MTSIKKASLFICICLFSISSVYAEIVTRAALDIGSGESKLTVADVDTDSNQVVQIQYQNHKVVELRKDLSVSPDGRLSPAIEESLLSALKQMQIESSSFAPQQWFGVGTSVFRTAKNGQEILDRIKAETNISISLVPQSEEAEIGFNSAVAASGLHPENVIAWDSGSGSFQITTSIDNRLTMYGAEFAFVPACEALFALRNQPYKPEISPNPVSFTEVCMLASAIQEKLPAIPEWLVNNHKQIIGFGGVTSIFSIGAIATGHTTYTKSQVGDALLALSDCTDKQLIQFPTPKDGMVLLVLLYAVMDHCGMEKITYCRTNGSCEGLLIMPRYWK